MIPIVFNYQYKNFPFSQRATQRSKQLGILTCGAMSIALGLFWVLFVNVFFVAIGIENDFAMALAMVSLIGYVILRKRLKEAGEQKVNAMALEDLLALRQQDPAAFAQYAAFLKELTEGFGGRAAPYQAPVYQTDHPQDTHAAPPEMSEPTQLEETNIVAEPPSQEAPQEIAQESPSKVFCEQCGTKLKPGSIFCHNCGCRL